MIPDSILNFVEYFFSKQMFRNYRINTDNK